MMKQEQAHQTIDHLADSAHELVDRLLANASQLQEGGASITAAGNDTLEQLTADPDALLEAVSDYIREHPLAAAGMALAAGYVVSRIV